MGVLAPLSVASDMFSRSGRRQVREGVVVERARQGRPVLTTPPLLGRAKSIFAMSPRNRETSDLGGRTCLDALFP